MDAKLKSTPHSTPTGGTHSAPLPTRPTPPPFRACVVEPAAEPAPLPPPPVVYRHDPEALARLEHWRGGQRAIPDRWEVLKASIERRWRFCGQHKIDEEIAKVQELVASGSKLEDITLDIDGTIIVQKLRREIVLPTTGPMRAVIPPRRNWRRIATIATAVAALLVATALLHGCAHAPQSPTQAATRANAMPETLAPASDPYDSVVTDFPCMAERAVVAQAEAAFTAAFNANMACRKRCGLLEENLRRAREAQDDAGDKLVACNSKSRPAKGKKTALR